LHIYALVKKVATFTSLSKSTDVILCSAGWIYAHIFSTAPSTAEDTKRHYLVSLKIAQVSSKPDCSSFLLPFSCFFPPFPICAFFPLNFSTSLPSSVFAFLLSVEDISQMITQTSLSRYERHPTEDSQIYIPTKDLPLLQQGNAAFLPHKHLAKEYSNCT